MPFTKSEYEAHEAKHREAGTCPRCISGRDVDETCGRCEGTEEYRYICETCEESPCGDEGERCDACKAAEAEDWARFFKAHPSQTPVAAVTCRRCCSPDCDGGRGCPRAVSHA